MREPPKRCRTLRRIVRDSPASNKRAKVRCLIETTLIQLFKRLVGLCPTGESDCSYDAVTETCRQFATQAKPVSFGSSSRASRRLCLTHKKDAVRFPFFGLLG